MTEMVKLDDVKQLWAQGHEATLSLFLNVSNARQENQASNPAWRTFLKQALREAAQQVSDADVWAAVEARVNTFFDSYRPASRGLVAFFSPDSEQIHELPVDVREYWSFGEPLIVPLLWMVDEYEPYLVVMVDREKAELITAYMGAANTEGSFENDMYSYDFGQKTLMPATSAVAGGRPLTQGSNREAYQDMINEHVARFHREVASEVEAFARSHPQIRVVIGGEEHSAHALRALLPEQFGGELVAVLPIPMRTSSVEIMQQVLPAASEHERQHELNLISNVIDFARSGGRGALGQKAVREALEMQRVELLLLPYPLDDENLAADFTSRVFQSGGDVELVHGEAADRLREAGGVAARLYYAL